MGLVPVNAASVGNPGLSWHPRAGPTCSRGQDWRQLVCLSQEGKWRPRSGGKVTWARSLADSGWRRPSGESSRLQTIPPPHQDCRPEMGKRWQQKPRPAVPCLTQRALTHTHASPSPSGRQAPQVGPSQPRPCPPQLGPSLEPAPGKIILFPGPWTSLVVTCCTTRKCHSPPQTLPLQKTKQTEQEKAPWS